MNLSSLNLRITASVTGSFLVAGISFLTSILLAKILSSSDFGLYQYMLSVGQSIVLIAGLNMSNAYYTYISKVDYSFFYHFIFAGVQLVFFVSLVFIILLFFKKLLFIDLKLQFIILCLFGSYAFFSLRQQAIYLFESQRNSVLLQAFLVISSVIYFLMIFIFGEKDLINISNVFSLMGAVYFILWLAAVYLFRSGNDQIISKTNWSNEVSSYKNYIMPLVFSLAIVQLGAIFDRWILQTNSGSIEQGYFGIAYRIATIATILSASIVNIFWKEVSSLLKSNKKVEALNLLVKWHDYVFTIVFFGCLYIFINADKIILLTYGDEYIDSIYALRVMAFYPMLQTSVHLLSTYLYSEALTFNIARASVITAIFGALFIFLFYALKTEIPGSEIISYKYIASSILLALLLSFYLKVIKRLWSFKKLFLHYPSLYLLGIIFDNWLNTLHLQNIIHLLFHGLFFIAIFIIYMMLVRYKSI